MAITNDLATRRVPVVGSVHVDPVGGFPSRVLSMLDLGSGGFFVHTAFPLPVGTRLACRFHLGDEPEPLQVHAEVAWIRPGPENMNPPPGMGLRFMRLSHAAHERILRVIEAHNEHIQYFQEHQELPEDAMKWKVPRVLLHLENKDISTRMEAWNGRFQVLTMALPFQQGQLVTTCAGDGSIEHGRIAWMQFVPDGLHGAEMQLGIELQMHSWGQETVLRRPTEELAASEANSEWEYEIIQSVPASMTMAPTLPLREETVPQAARPATSALPPIEDKLLLQAESNFSTMAPILPANPLAAEAPPPPNAPSSPQDPAQAKAIPAAALAPSPMPALRVESAVRRPAPPLPSDTYPVAPSSGGWPLTGRATALLLAIAGLLGAAVLMSHPTSPLTPKYHLAASGRLRSTDLRELLGRQTPAYTPTRGKSAVFSKSASRVPAAPAALSAVTTKQTASSADQHEAKTLETTPNTAVAAKPAAINPTFQFSSHARTTTLVLPGKAGGKTQHYYLADPTGVVLDIEDAHLAAAGGMHPGDAHRIRKIKVVPMNRKTRIIIYTQGLPEKVEIVPKSDPLQVRLTFSEKMAKR